jgi:hypothetical protein
MILTLASATLESINIAINGAKIAYLVVETTIYVPYSIYCYMTKDETKEEEMIEISKTDLKTILEKVNKIEQRDEKIEKLCESIMETKI